MATIANCANRFAREDYFVDILTLEENGGWTLRLPPALRAHQGELEQLLGKVFAGGRSTRDNLALAQQMSLNWCVSKARQNGKSLEDCLSDSI